MNEDNIIDNMIETTDLEHWMTNLPLRLRALPLVYLAIPGMSKKLQP